MIGIFRKKGTNSQAQKLNHELELARDTIADLQAELDETNRGLLALSMELEDRVAKRTRDLEQTNLQLKSALLERERAEEKIRALARFPAQNPHPVLRVSTKGKLLYANDAARPVLDAWGAEQNENLPQEWKDFITTVYKTATQKNLELQCGPRTYITTFSPVAGADHLNIYAHEITERKNAEEALKWELQVNTDLAHLAKEVFNLAEDLTPVTKKVLQYACNLTGSQNGLIVSLNELTHQVSVHSLKIHSATDQNNNRKVNCIDCFPKEVKIEGKNWLHCPNLSESFFKNQAADSNELADLPARHEPIEKYLRVLVNSAEKTVGQIILANSGRDYEQKDLDAIEQLSSLYALALDRHKASGEKALLEKNLRQAQKLEAAGSLAGGIAHDFNNILAAMIGYVNLAMHQLEGQDIARRNLDMVVKASLRARNLIRQILAFSRHSEKEPKPLNISPVVKEAIKLVRASMPSSIEIRQNIVSDPGNILGDPNQIHQIVMNLCTNAFHAMGQDSGVLTIDLGQRPLMPAEASLKPGLRPGNYVYITIGDTGHGIDEDMKERIFEPYFTTKESHEGTGLGLSVVHGIVKGMGGDISVSSEKGKGATFTILIPSIAQEATEVKAADKISTGRGERILFVDDEELLVDVATQMLPRMGYEVTGFTSSLEALKAFGKRPDGFDLVITDYTMPKMIGTQLAREISKIRPDIPILLCTGFNKGDEINKYKEFGVQAVLLKPLYEHELAKVVRQVLDKGSNHG